MKILFFSYAFPNRINPGLGTFNRTMIAGLANDHDVRVVSPVPFTDVWNAWSKGKLPHGLNDSTFQVIPKVPTEYCTWYYTPKVFRNRYGQFMQRSVGSTLDRVMREFQPEIVLSYWTHPDGEVAVNAAHRFGIRAVTMVGGTDVLINGRNSSRRKPILDVLHAADGVVTVSEDLKQVLVADGIPQKKVSVSRRGIDHRIFHEGNRNEARRKLCLPDDRPILISVGRLVGVKGHTHLIEACRLLTERGCQFRCCFLGDGPLRATLQTQVEASGLSKIIEFRGSQTSVQLADWYRAANLSVLASLSEGVPNVLLESIACGTPFVASNVGGIPEIADLTRDSLAPAANPAELADAIAFRLSTIAAVHRKPRRFLPMTARESAEDLASILRSVQTGTSRLLMASPGLHETMTEAEIPSTNPAENLAPVGKASAPGEHCPTHDATVHQREDCYHLHEFATLSTVSEPTLISTHPRMRDTISVRNGLQDAPTATVVTSNADLGVNREEDSCARTGEHFGLKVSAPASANDTSPSRIASSSCNLSNRDGCNKERVAENVDPLRRPDTVEMQFDKLGRTAEGFIYVDAEISSILDGRY